VRLTPLRTAVIVGLVLLVVVGVVMFLNVPANSGDVDRERHVPAEYEGGTQEVPFVYEMASSVQPETGRHRIRRWRGSTESAPLATPDCNAIVTKDRAVNKYGDTLFSIQVKASWCWRNGRISYTEFDRDYNVGDEWWNLYKFRTWRQPVRTVRPRYVYNRQGAYFEACATFCFIDSDAWIAQTLRRGGSHTSDWKGR